MTRIQLKAWLRESAFHVTFDRPLWKLIEQNVAPDHQTVSQAAMNIPFTRLMPHGHWHVSPLYYAIRLGRFHWMEYLLALGASPNWTGESLQLADKCFQFRYTALHHLLHSPLTDHEQILAMQALLSSGAYPNHKDYCHDTPFHHLVQRPFTQTHRTLAKQLLQARANPFIRNHMGLTAMDSAVQYGYFAWATWLRTHL